MAKTNKLWAGRTGGEVDARFDGFNSSILFDSRMYREDILGSVAHAEMLGACGIIHLEDSRAIIAGLEEILGDIESGAWELDMTAEDIHMCIEAELTRRIGGAGKRLHTGRSRNDQVATDLRLCTREHVKRIQAQILELVNAFLTHAKAHTESVMPGYTHLQRAQPVTLAHQLMAYCEMLIRDWSRLDDAVRRMDEGCPLGSGALAGTTYPIDREMTAKALGFTAPCRSSLDGVSDRDYCVEILAALSLLMVHLSRYCEEIILWCSHEFKFVTLPNKFSSGSSIMPQKKNPDACELARGKTGRVIGSLTGTLVMLKGLPLAYNKDMQEDKEALFDSLDTVSSCLETLTPMTAALKYNRETMRSAAAGGFINATDCADYLTAKGMPFREAYKVTGGLVALCSERGLTLETLPLEDYKAVSDVFENDVYEVLSLEACVNRRRSSGGPAPERVAEHIAWVEAFLEERCR